MAKLDPNDFHRDPSSLRGTRLRVEDAPDWVVKRKVKNASRRDGHPVTLLLFDRQVYPEKAIRYTRFVRRLETPQAVQDAGRIELDFDPATQTLLIHSISIFRGGKLTNLADLEDVEIIQRERDLDKGIYAGSITALILLKDVRTGDVIDIESSIHSDAAIFPNNYWFMENFEHSIPVVRQYLSWLAQDHARYTISSSADHVSEEDESTQWGVRRTWHVEDAGTLEPEPALPPGLNPFKHISLTDYRSWQQVVAEIAAMWEGRSEPGDELPKELASLQAANTESDEQLIEACVVFVRDNIRYQGVEIGKLGLVPEMLHEIWARRFGDCKEKTSLLCWFLRQCGFEAFPALVSTQMLAYVADQLPAPIFDHVVVHLFHKGQHYWIDPTNISQRGSLKSWTSLPFQKALLISNNTTDFLDVADPIAGSDKIKVLEDYKFTSGTSGTLDVTHQYFGVEADGVRQVLDSTGRNAVQQIFVDIVKSTRSQAEIETDLEVTDDPTSNLITLSARFKTIDLLKKDGQSGFYYCEFVPHSILGKIVGIDDKPRKHPLGMVHPVEIEHVTRLDHPEARGAVVPRTMIDNEFINFEAGSRNSKQGSELFYKYRTKVSEIPVKAIVRYQVNLEQIGKSISMMFECQSPAPSGKIKQRRRRASTAPSWDEGEYNNTSPRQSRSHGYHAPNKYSGGGGSKASIGLGCLVIFVILKVIALIAAYARG